MDPDKNQFILPRYKRKIKMVDRIKEAKKLKSALFIYSCTDHWTTVEMGERFQKNCAAPSELWIVENAQHAQIMKSGHSEAYKRKILQYFDQSASI